MLLSFDKKVAFYKKWKALFPAIFIMSAIFIAWDVYFTHLGIWGFNPKYLSGIYILNLPVEECLFFIVVPYACMFIYECLNAYIRIDLFKQSYLIIYTILAFILILIAVMFYHQLYTSITFAGCGILIIFMVVYFKSPYLSRFLLAYIVCLLPFLLINGILTGSMIDEQVVWYNSYHIFNLRIFTIPIEDTIYNLFMLLTTLTGYEYFKCRFNIACAI
jgi:lycopene cyclase domain-containing protein